jgi:hypothetical protein
MLLTVVVVGAEGVAVVGSVVVVWMAGRDDGDVVVVVMLRRHEGEGGSWRFVGKVISSGKGMGMARDVLVWVIGASSWMLWLMVVVGVAWERAWSGGV